MKFSIFDLWPCLNYWTKFCDSGIKWKLNISSFKSVSHICSRSFSFASCSMFMNRDNNKKHTNFKAHSNTNWETYRSDSSCDRSRREGTTFYRWSHIDSATCSFSIASVPELFDYTVYIKRKLLIIIFFIFI